MYKLEFVQISEHIYRLTYGTVVGIPVKISTWYVVDGEDVYIIDTGMEDYAYAQLNAKKIFRHP